MDESACFEGEGRLLRSVEGFWVLMEKPQKFLWRMTNELLADMALATCEDADKITSSLGQVLSWAQDILVKVSFEKDLLVSVRLGEILLEAAVTKVEPYCSELRAARGRTLKVVQRLFDGNTPQLESRYIIGIPWSRRDLKRNWASSVHKRVKVRKSVLPKKSFVLTGNAITRTPRFWLKSTSTIESPVDDPVSTRESCSKSTEPISASSLLSSVDDPSPPKTELSPILPMNYMAARARQTAKSRKMNSYEADSSSEQSSASDDSDLAPSNSDDWSIIVGPRIIAPITRSRTKSSKGRRTPTGSRATSPGMIGGDGDLQRYEQEQVTPSLDLDSCLHQ